MVRNVTLSLLGKMEIHVSARLNEKLGKESCLHMKHGNIANIFTQKLHFEWIDNTRYSDYSGGICKKKNYGNHWRKIIYHVHKRCHNN